VKYTQRGRVTIGCRRAGSGLRIEVHDTGPGIPANKQKLIFEEFRRLGGDEGRVTGLGLGLSIVERISRVLGSGVALRSKLGRGSVFAVTVPLAKRRLPPTPVKLKPTARLGLGNTTQVLVIDNEPAIVAGMTHLLEGWGCRVHAALAPGEALALVGNGAGNIDMILADYHLGTAENGIALIGKLRRAARQPIPAILITADRSQAVAGEAGAHDIQVLRKPIKPAALRAAMAHLALTAGASR